MKKTLNCAAIVALTLSIGLTGCSEEKAPESEEKIEETQPESGDKTEGKTEGSEESESTDKGPEEASANDAPKESEATAPSEEAQAPQKIAGAINPDSVSPEAKKKAVADEKQSRQEALQEVYALGRKGDEQSVNGLVKIIRSEAEPGIRATAVRVLGRNKRDELVGILTEEAKGDALPVKIEAAILLYQWGETKTALPVLEQLSSQGVALRRAFLTGRKDGKNQYDKAGVKFLKKGLKSDNVYTRLDAALGLFEMKSDKKALDVFRSVMETEETFYVRMAALNYLRHLKADPTVRGLIELGTKDKDERVSQRANQILNEPSKRRTGEQK